MKVHKQVERRHDDYCSSCRATRSHTKHHQYPRWKDRKSPFAYSELLMYVLLQLYCCGYQVTRTVLLYTLLICGIININSVMNVFVCLLFCIIYNKIVTPRTDRSISTSWYGSFREDRFLICMIYLAHAAGWELYNLQNLPCLLYTSPSPRD